MCGRFALSATTEQVEKLLPQLYSSKKIVPNYNISPGQEIAAILNTNPNKILNVKWGLIPSWATDRKMAQKMINARAETVFEKPSFKALIKRKRCLIPADGFFEWKKDENTNEKIPYYIKMKSDETFTFAGLWDEWYDKENNSKILSATILTTEPNELIKSIHNRMPVIILENQRNLWLSENISYEQLVNLMKPVESELLEAYPVSTRVNSPINNEPQILSPINH